jgi:CO/xanthine dehydrogenase Mo-binding subunit
VGGRSPHRLGYQSKQEAGKYSVIVALLAQKTARPIRLFLTREETFLCVGNRASHIMTLKAGVKKDGTLTALQLTGLGEVGAYPSNTSGVGVAGGMFGEQFGPPANAIVCLNADGSVDLDIGAAGLGAGTTPYTRVSGGSKTVFGDSPAVRSAALEVKACLLEMAAEDLKVPLSDLVFKDGAVLSKGGKRSTLADLVQPRTRQMVVGVGRRDPDLVDKIVRPFAAHFAEVEVNTRTGEMRVVLSGVAPAPWRSLEAEQALIGKPLDAATAEAAAAAAVKPAVPLAENAYKVPLVRGILEETLLALAV